MVLVDAQCFTSGFSGNNGGGRVEVAFLRDEVAVRYTEGRALPPQHYGVQAWEAFLGGVRAGEFRA